MSPKHDITTAADIKVLVDSFYEKVLKDPVIGFIFTDVARLSMEKHMPVMYSFWSSLLLNTGTYSGNPMHKHLELDKKVKLESAHFERWMQLWKETITGHFSGPRADEAASRAGQIAFLMQNVLERGR
jgi:hemoglobin